MFNKLLISVFGVFFVLSGTAQAAPEDVVYYDLSLAGYQSGMTYDEASEVRPLQYVQNSQEGSDGASVIDAFIEQVYIDDVEMNLWLRFKNGKLYKVFARFSPEAIQNMLQRFQEALGPGENKSRTIKSYDDKEIQQTIYLWDYPHSKMHLIGISSVSEYATVSLVSKRENAAPSGD